MAFYLHPSVGLMHLQEVKPRKPIPAGTTHRWDKKAPAWGESTTCLKCGCQKHRLKTQPDYTERYQLAGSTELLSERPPCTGTPATPQPAQGQLDL